MLQPREFTFSCGKSRIKRYIDTKPNSELIHYCLQNPPYTYQWAEKTVPVAEGSSETTTERRAVNVAGARENVGTPVVQKSGIPRCYNWEGEAVVIECMTKLIGRMIRDDDLNNRILEAHYMYMAQLQEVTPDQVDNSRPIFDDEPMHKVQNNNDNYNVFAMENEHPEQPESSNDIYLTEQGDSNITIDSSDI
ncbi:hypothetical protein Tco_0425019 [Tanacetum coccineum]